MTTTSITTPTTPREEREVAPSRAAPADWVREEEGRRGEEKEERRGERKEEQEERKEKEEMRGERKEEEEEGGGTCEGRERQPAARSAMFAATR